METEKGVCYVENVFWVYYINLFYTMMRSDSKERSSFAGVKLHALLYAGREAYIVEYWAVSGLRVGEIYIDGLYPGSSQFRWRNY